jgi:hypothetical protein
MRRLRHQPFKLTETLCRLADVSNDDSNIAASAYIIAEFDIVRRVRRLDCDYAQGLGDKFLMQEGICRLHMDGFCGYIGVAVPARKRIISEPRQVPPWWGFYYVTHVYFSFQKRGLKFAP